MYCSSNNNLFVSCIVLYGTNYYCFFTPNESRNQTDQFRLLLVVSTTGSTMNNKRPVLFHFYCPGKYYHRNKINIFWVKKDYQQLFSSAKRSSNNYVGEWLIFFPWSCNESPSPLIINNALEFIKPSLLCSLVIRYFHTSNRRCLY